MHTHETRSVTMDLLRGAACLMILVYHLRFSRPVGLGQAAMEVFFVLSGYLIARSLSWSVNQFGLRGIRTFALRRLRRLLPGMLAFLLGALALNLTRPEFAFDTFALASLFSVVGGYNFYQVYYAPNVIGFGGIWSLSLEEQFYITAIISVLISRAIRAKSTNQLLGLAVALALVGLLFRIAAYVGCYDPGDRGHLPYLPPLRMWGFGLGALIAYLETQESFKDALDSVGDRVVTAVYLLSVGAIACLVASVTDYNAQTFMHQWTLIPAFAAVLVAFAPRIDVHAQQFSARLPSLLRRLSAFVVAYLRLVGLASYSIYLWHCLVIAGFERYGAQNSSIATISMSVLSIAAGIACWQLVEKRFYNFGLNARHTRGRH